MNDGALMVESRSTHAAPGPDARDCFASFHKAPSGNYGKGLSNVLFADGHVDLASSADSYKYASPRMNIP
jgi:prepilin-type processing-associated H-X9-DG protein